MKTVKAAIAPLDLGGNWVDQTQSLHDTLASYTRDNAWAEFNEDKKGKLREGMDADVAIMSHDLTQLAPANITQANAVMTICSGEITYQRPN
ncbi:amidohydrolase family protein [Ascidiaceihabitans sp.]|nr:amidohydrolase family protein [Ascidiaceihabitans sp.]